MVCGRITVVSAGDGAANGAGVSKVTADVATMVVPVHNAPMITGVGRGRMFVFGLVAALFCGAIGCGQTSAAGGGTDDGGSCGDAFAPPKPQPGMPTAPGCYEGVDGGWIPILCACQLPIDNKTASAASFIVTLAMNKTSPSPTFGGSLDVKVSFDDPDASWYAVWAKQPKNGTDYVATNTDGQTVVELGVPNLVLAPVPLSACGARLGTASISGVYDRSWSGLGLLMTASIEGRGSGAATTSVTCEAPVPL